MQSIDLIICNETLTLDPRRCIYWEKRNVIILSDWHIGKSAHFRKHGIAIPRGVNQKDLDRVNQILSDYTVKEIWIIGDMFHAQHNSELDDFAIWRTKYQDIAIKLIGGNHDIISQQLLNQYNIDFIKNTLVVEPFVFAHKPKLESDACFQISGHIHPGVELQGLGNLKVKLPCFIVGDEQLVLPAFCNFTGLDTRFDIGYGELRKFAIADQSVIEI